MNRPQPQDENLPDREDDAQAATSDEESGDDMIEVAQPGLQPLREAVANYARRRVPGPPKVREDGIAGLTNAINNVPDGMANAVIVGVNPVFGLYATMMGPLTGGFLSSTRLMVITTTAAASLTASQALISVPVQERGSALALMVILTGILMAVFGQLGFGRLLRFVSYSVTTGFLTGVSILLILSQLSTVAGYEASGNNRLSQTIDLLAHLGEINLWSLALGVLTLSLALLLPLTPIGNFGRLVAIVVPSLLLVIFGAGGVQTVRDVGEIPSGLPTPALPSLSALSFEVVTGAAALALVILVQGAGVSQSVPNPDGTPRRTSRDFIAQGAANIASGLFRGIPVGGSLSATALNVISGARTRWSVIFAGLWMAVIVVVFPGLVAYVAMPALGALLIVAGSSSISPVSLRAVWRAGWPARIAGGTTFLAMLFLPIQAAVGIGVSLAAMLYVIRSSSEIVIVELFERPDGRIEEREVPEKLRSNGITVLDVHGEFFFAAARTLERQLPDPRGTERPVVILRLRGEPTMGATLADVLATYANKLGEAGGRLYVTGMSPQAFEQANHRRGLLAGDSVKLYKGTSIREESTRTALADAQQWLAEQADDDTSDDDTTRRARRQRARSVILNMIQKVRTVLRRDNRD